ncbi:hypothetical protein [Chlorobium sp. N1]|uniref:hypothetical protein n=1 Tax=Chlorobium sp. N1 TaxID=2491138 RepID=UPI0010398EE2|nr:hypothetical protein [Chlorobium sp. N1]TCD47214.1 hypothetical protein E0L29_08980 [Chlorobium sp. N1]
MRVVENENTAIVCDSGQTKHRYRTFRGVLLKDFIDSAGVDMPNPRRRGEYYVLVRSTDDYNVIFAYNELYYGPAGEHTWVVFETDGEPLGENGPFLLLTAGDRVTGPRYVKCVNAVEVSKVAVPAP